MLKHLLKKPPTPQPKTITVGECAAVVKRSARRKTLTIKVEGARVQVHAPDFSSNAEIEDFLRRKKNWIQEKVAHQQIQLHASRRYWRSGEKLPLRGENIYLDIAQGSKGEVALHGDTLVVQVRQTGAEGALERRVQALVQQWYKQEAVLDFANRMDYWQKVTGIQATSHCVKTYKARWGSCNHRHELSFNWKLIMAPAAVIDYVVVHELCHIIHFNHSPAYWSLVGSYLPHYESQKSWLRHNGLSLEL